MANEAVTYRSEAELDNAIQTATTVEHIVDKGGYYTVVGTGLPIPGPTPPSQLSPEVQDVVDLMTGLTQPQIDAIEVFVNAERDDGRWGTKASSYTDALYDAFWCFGLTIEANALISWHPNFAGTAINNGATKAADGFSFNNNEIDTNFNILNDSINYQLEDCIFGAYIKDITVNANSNFIGNSAATDLDVYVRNNTANNRAQWAVNSARGAGTISAGNLSNETLETYVRGVHVTDQERYINAILTDDNGNPSSSLLNASIVLGKGSDNPFVGTISAFFTSAAVGFNQSEFNTNLITLFTSLGVLP